MVFRHSIFKCCTARNLVRVNLFNAALQEIWLEVFLLKSGQVEGVSKLIVALVRNCDLQLIVQQEIVSEEFMPRSQVYLRQGLKSFWSVII